MKLRPFQYKGPRTINEAFTTLVNMRDVSGIVIYHDDIESLWEIFQKQFVVIKAAGGLVRNRKGEYLFIYRYGKWDLPKGKIEAGENEREASIREVQEECGIKKLEITDELPLTCHIYELEGNFVLKETFWFRMVTTDDGKLKPQKDEGITKAQWFSDQDVFSIAVKNTYPSVKELVTRALPPVAGKISG